MQKLAIRSQKNLAIKIRPTVVCYCRRGVCDACDYLYKDSRDTDFFLPSIVPAWILSLKQSALSDSCRTIHMCDNCMGVAQGIASILIA